MRGVSAITSPVLTLCSDYHTVPLCTSHGKSSEILEKRSAKLENWKPVPVPDYADRYEISDQGQLRKLAYMDTNGRWRETKIIKSDIDWSGYPAFTLRSGAMSLKKRAHVLVAGAFLGPKPDGLEICHNDSNPLNCRADNLRYDTRKSNFADKKLAGTENTGSRHGMSKITENDVLRIRALRKAGVSVKDILLEFNIGRSTVYQIIERRRWTHI